MSLGALRFLPVDPDGSGGNSDMDDTDGGGDGGGGIGQVSLNLCTKWKELKKSRGVWQKVRRSVGEDLMEQVVCGCVSRSDGHNEDGTNEYADASLVARQEGAAYMGKKNGKRKNGKKRKRHSPQ